MAIFKQLTLQEKNPQSRDVNNLGILFNDLGSCGGSSI